MTRSAVEVELAKPVNANTTSYNPDNTTSSQNPVQLNPTAKHACITQRPGVQQNRVCAVTSRKSFCIQTEEVIAQQYKNPARTANSS